MLWVYAVIIVLALYAVVDCLRTPTDDLPGRLPKFIWLLIILLISIIGPIAWIVISWATRAEKNSTDGSISIPRNPTEIFKRSSTSTQDPPQMVPPDENPDFLFSLEAQIRRKKIQEKEKLRKKNQGKTQDSSANNQDTDL